MECVWVIFVREFRRNVSSWRSDWEGACWRGGSVSPTDWLWTTSSTFSTFFFRDSRDWAQQREKFALPGSSYSPPPLLLLPSALWQTPPPFPIPGRTHSHPQYLLGRSSIYHLILPPPSSPFLLFFFSFVIFFLLLFLFVFGLLAFNPTRRTAAAAAVDSAAHIFRRQRPTATTTRTRFFFYGRIKIQDPF